MCSYYKPPVRRGCRLVGPREVTFSSSEAVTYDRPDGGHKVPYTSHTDTPATTPQRRPHNHYAEECSRTYELTSSYVDPVDNVVNRPLLLPGGPKPNGGVGPNYEEPSCISGSGPGSVSDDLASYSPDPCSYPILEDFDNSYCAIYYIDELFMLFLIHLFGHRDRQVGNTVLHTLLCFRQQEHMYPHWYALFRV